MESHSNGNQKVMKAEEVSRLLRMPLSTVYNLAAKGKIPAVKFGRQWRFLEKDILDYLSGIHAQSNQAGTDLHEKREYPRMKAEIPAVISGGLSHTGEIHKEGTLLNISEGGAYFIPTETGLGVGDPIRIGFSLPNDMVIEGRIVHENRNSKKGFGIKFRQLSHMIQEVIRAYVG